MTPVIVLAVFIGTPVLIGLLLRIRSLYLYTSIVVGELLIQFVGDDAAVVASGIMKGQYSQMVSSLFLLLIPLLITILVLRRTTPKTQVFIELPALVAVGGTLYIFAVPLLTAGVIGSILGSPIGSSVNKSQDIIIASAGLIVLSTMWLTNKHKESKHGKHHK